MPSRPASLISNFDMLRALSISASACIVAVCCSTGRYASRFPIRARTGPQSLKVSAHDVAVPCVKVDEFGLDLGREPESRVEREGVGLHRGARRRRRPGCRYLCVVQPDCRSEPLAGLLANASLFTALCVAAHREGGDSGAEPGAEDGADNRFDPFHVAKYGWRGRTSLLDTQIVRNRVATRFAHSFDLDRIDPPLTYRNTTRGATFRMRSPPAPEGAFGIMSPLL